jgi:ubiquinone/menaquinone biosynthesis C-methylase UbiE
MSFRELLAHRSAAIYADFLLPHLTATTRLLDLGCGAGSITVGLADSVRLAIGLDPSTAELWLGADHVRVESIQNVHLVGGNGTRLPFREECFDAVLAHSVLEVTPEPAAVLGEAFRVLRPGGVLAAASVEYGGRVLAGPHRETLERFYAVRERLWELDRIARPRAGRELRRLLHGCGLTDIEATAHYLSYGTPAATQAFGEARARDCEEAWFTSRSVAHQLLTEEELRETNRAWLEWSRSPESFLAFAWCRAVGWKPVRRQADGSAPDV